MAPHVDAARDGGPQDGSDRSRLGLIRRTVFWALFAALAALFLYGFRSSGLFQQHLWTELGLKRLAWFASIYAAWTITGTALFPRWFTRATVALAAVYAVAAVGIRAPAAVLFFLSSSWVLGLLLGMDGLLALILGISIYTLLIGLLVHLPVNYPIAYAALFAIPWILGWRRAHRSAEWRIHWPERPGRLRVLAAALLGMAVTMHLLVVLGPEVGADGLAVHLTIPASIMAHHRWVLDVHRITWAVMPLNGDWSFTGAYALGGEMAARLINFSLLLLMAALLYQLLRRILPPAPSLLFTALCVSSPIVQLVTGSLFVENFWAALLTGAFAALVRYHETGEARFARVAAVLSGAGLATKFGSFAFLIPFAVLLGLELRRNRALRLAPQLVLIALLFGAPPYVRAWWETANPVFPFMNNVFRSPDFPKESFTDGRYRQPLSPGALYDVTFHTSRRLEGQNGGWAFQFLFLLPMAVLLMPRSAGYAPWAALILSLAFSIATLAPQSNVRYIYPALPLFTLAIGGMAAGMRQASPAAFATIACSAVVLAGLNLYFLPASGWSHQDFFVNSVFDPHDRDRYLDAVSPRRRLVDYLNEKHRGAPALFVETSQIAGFLGEAYTTTWHTYSFAQPLLATRNALDCLRYLHRFNLTYVVTPADAGQISFAPLRQMIASFTTVEYENHGWQVRRVRAAFAGANLPESLRLMSEGRWEIGPGQYDDTNPQLGFIGRWMTDRQFTAAANGSITYSNHPGDMLRLTFNGTRVIWVYTKAFNRGEAEVTIDGVHRSTVDLFAPRTEWQQRISFSERGGGKHVLEVRVTGRKNAAAADCFVDADQLIVE